MSDLSDKLLEIKRQKDEYILPENLKKNITIFNVTGTYDGGLADGVKLFNTVEEMNNDSSASLGDYAIVYGNNIQPLTQGTSFNKLQIPKQVILDTSFTGSVDYTIYETQSYSRLQIFMNQNYFNAMYEGEDDYIYVAEYNSDDGITYNRVSSFDTYTFSNEFTESYGTWNDIIGKFLGIGGMKYEGLYQYTNALDERYVVSGKFVVENGVLSWQNINTYDKNLFVKVIKNIILNASTSDDKRYGSFVLEKVTDTEYKWYSQGYGGTKWWFVEPRLYFPDNNPTTCYLCKYDGYASYSGNFKGTLNIATGDYTFEEVTDFTDILNNGTTRMAIADITDKEMLMIRMSDGDTSTPKVFPTQVDCYYYDGSSNQGKASPSGYQILTNYKPCDTQFTLQNPNEILPGVIALGKYDTIEGDGTVYDNLDLDAAVQRIVPTLPLSVDKNNAKHYGMLTECANLKLTDKYVYKLVRDNTDGMPFNLFEHLEITSSDNMNYDQGFSSYSSVVTDYDTQGHIYKMFGSTLVSCQYLVLIDIDLVNRTVKCHNVDTGNSGDKNYLYAMHIDNNVAYIIATNDFSASSNYKAFYTLDLTTDTFTKVKSSVTISGSYVGFDIYNNKFVFANGNTITSYTLNGVSSTLSISGRTEQSCCYTNTYLCIAKGGGSSGNNKQFYYYNRKTGGSWNSVSIPAGTSTNYYPAYTGVKEYQSDLYISYDIYSNSGSYKIVNGSLVADVKPVLNLYNQSDFNRYNYIYYFYDDGKVQKCANYMYDYETNTLKSYFTSDEPEYAMGIYPSGDDYVVIRSAYGGPIKLRVAYPVKQGDIADNENGVIIRSCDGIYHCQTIFNDFNLDSLKGV